MAQLRARRAELSGDALRDYAGEVEAELTRARAELDAARDQRADLAGQLKQAERELRASRQNEHAETARRTELEEDTAATRREAEEEVVELRRVLAAREHRVAELEEELSRLLSSGVHERLHENQQNVARLERALASERSTRESALRDLTVEREQSQAEVTLLQHELDRRGHVHDAVSRQLVELRTELDVTRAQLSVDAGRTAVAEAVLADLGNTAAQLRSQLTDLETERAELLQQLATARAEVAQRDQLLQAGHAALLAAEAAQEQLRTELREAGAALRTAASDAAERHVRLQAVEQAMGAAEARARDLTRRLETERLQRVQAESALNATVVEERDAFQRAIDAQRAEFDAAIASERQAFETQMAGVRDGVAKLRDRLTTTQAELAAELEAERAARSAAEQQAAAERAARDAADEQAETERVARATAEQQVQNEYAARVRAEQALAERASIEHEILQGVAELRSELVRVRAESEKSVAREAHLEGLVGELVTTTDALNAEFERELAALEAEQEQELAGQRAQFSTQLSELENRVVDLREQMGAATVDMVRKLEDERTARRRAEALLTQERERADLALEAAETDADEDDVVAQLRSEIKRSERQNTLAEERIVELEDELEQARIGPPATATDKPAPPADPAGSVAAVAAEADSVIIDLARAAARLRGRKADDGAPAVERPDTGSGTPAAPAAPRATESHGAEPGAAESDVDLAKAPAAGDAAAATQVPDAVVDEDTASPAAADAESSVPAGTPPARLLEASRRASRRLDDPEPEPAESILYTRPSAVADADTAGEPDADDVEQVEDFELGARLGRFERPDPHPWLAPAIGLLARRDPRVAASVIEAMIPLQAARLQEDLAYDMAIAGHPELRVELRRDGTAVIAPRDADDAADSASFRIVGSPVALSVYVGGGAARRGTPGVAITGRKRRAKALTRVMREPVVMPELALLAGRLPSLTLLTLLVATIDPAETRGDHFTLAFAEGDNAPAVHVVVASGLPVVARSGAPVHIAATVRTPVGGLASFLGGQGAARVNGDINAVGRFLAWADGAQGLDG
ncbi:hypothetical protein DSM112329_02322 [Paraconexibacter sp. AEG42_29]|uniref:SCP2 domain-containing protein n=1 Tax=Paraconexibacter sp. AEG42_29 TaxID=2997339 RepID=A0AAU7AUZ7_9ACTN